MEIKYPYPAPKSTFVFDHIPRTGGTTLRTIFESLLGQGEVSPPVLGRSEQWAVRRFASYRLITGHFLPQPGDGLGDGRAHVTVLRDPLDRAISEYFFLRNHAPVNRPDDPAVLAKSHDLDGFLRLEEQRPTGWGNRMCRHFAMKMSRDLGNDQRMLTLAKMALEQYDFVGIFEHLTDSIDLFCEQFCLPQVKDVPRLNGAEGRLPLHDLAPLTLARLRALNQVDLALHEYALCLFQARKRRAFQRLIQARHAEPWSEGKPAPELQAGAAGGGQSATVVALAKPGPAKPEAFGDRRAEIIEVRVQGQLSGDNRLSAGERTLVSIDLVAHADTPDLVVGIKIDDWMGETAYGTNTELLAEPRPVAAGSRHRITFAFPANLNAGRYSLTVAAQSPSDQPEHCFHWWDDAASFDIIDYIGPRFLGYARLAARVEWSEEQPDATADETTEPPSQGVLRRWLSGMWRVYRWGRS